MSADETRLQVRTFPFRDGVAAEASAVVDTTVEELWPALLELEDFPDHIPAIDFARITWLEDDLARCELKGKIGVWKFGISLDMTYQMKVVQHESLDMVRYENGVFKDIYFKHRVEPLDDGEQTLLTSTFYFDMTGFPLLRVLRFFERFPWMAEMLNMAAAAMLVRSFQLRWEEDA